MERLIELLKVVEGFRYKAYWDVRQWTYGYGCRAPGESSTITKDKAEVLLEIKVQEAEKDFARVFAGHLDKFNDPRKEAFTEMIFQMGAGKPGGKHGLYSFKNTLALIYNKKTPEWEKVSKNLLQSYWAKQTPERARRVTNQILTGEFQNY